MTDVAGLAATVQNYLRSGSTTDSAKMICRVFGGIFVLMGILMIAGGLNADKYHNLMHLTWGPPVWRKLPGVDHFKALLHWIGRVLSGTGILGLLIGNPSMNRAWYLGPMLLHTGDQIFHLMLGSLFLGVGLVSGREWRPRHVQLSGN